MIRTLMMLAGVISFVLLAAEGAGVAVLWFQGRLTRDRIEQVQTALTGAGAEAESSARPAEKGSASVREVLENRTVRVLDLDTRENELKSLKSLTTDAANQLIRDRQTFDEMKGAFRKELAALKAQFESEAAEQTRGIVAASSPEDAAQRLMGLELEECVGLLRGLPEKTISKILQAFAGDVKTAERGQQIFEAIYRSEPERVRLQAAEDRLGAGNRMPR